jgi:hypothetical protein
MKKFPVVLILLLGTMYVAPMLGQSPKYPPLSEYLMARDVEVALAKSAAPDHISGHATIKVFTASGFQTVHEGDNGFVCVVMRGFSGAPTFTPVQVRDYINYDAKTRAPICLDPQAARTVLPYYELRTKLGLEGKTAEQIAEGVQAAYVKGEIPKRPKCVLPTCGRRSKCLGRRAIGIHISWFTFLITIPCSAPNTTPKALFHPSGTMREQRLRSGLSPSTTNWP